MSQDLTRLYDRSKIGATVPLVFTDGGSTRLELVDDTAAVANRVSPKLFLIRTNADVHLRQGNNAVVATTSDLLIFADSYYQIMVEDGRDNHIATIGPSGSSGSIFVTNVSEV